MGAVTVGSWWWQPGRVHRLLREPFAPGARGKIATMADVIRTEVSPGAGPVPLVDLLVVGDVVTVDAARRIVVDGAVAVGEGRIVEVGAAAALSEKYRDVCVLGRRGDLVTPGYVNAHQHLTADRLVRSDIPDDLPPGASIFGWIVPVHAAVDGRDDEVSALLSLVEAVGNGITSTVEAGTVAHPERVLAAYEAVGVRGTIGTWGTDTPGLPGSGAVDEVIARQAALLALTADGDGERSLVRPWVTLVGHDLMSDELVTAASELARRSGVGLTFHLSPTTSDPESYLARTGLRPVQHLHALGALGPHVLLAHAVHLDRSELDLILDSGTTIASCPWAYLRLGQGFAVANRHVEFWRRGGRLALGCDAENAGDAIDALRTAALFAGLAKDVGADPTRFGAHDALELLTGRGAEAIGWGDDVGSIEVGKRADLVVHDTTGPQWATRSADPVLQLVWASDGRSVRDVVVDGQVVVENGRCSTVDVDALVAEANDRRRHLLRRAGIEPASRWPMAPMA